MKALNDAYNVMYSVFPSEKVIVNPKKRVCFMSNVKDPQVNPAEHGAELIVEKNNVQRGVFIGQTVDLCQNSQIKISCIDLNEQPIVLKPRRRSSSVFCAARLELRKVLRAAQTTESSTYRSDLTDQYVNA